MAGGPGGAAPDLPAGQWTGNWLWLKDEERGLQDNVATVKRALDLGYVTIINLAAAQASLQKVHLQVLTIEQQREQERLALNQALGLPPEQRLALSAHLEPPSPLTLPSLQEISRNLEERRLDLLALKIGYQSQEERLRTAILAQVPKINIGFAHASDTTHVITTGFAVTIDLPIFNRNQGRIAIETASRQKLFDE
jgi:outer membrane protein TolC